MTVAAPAGRTPRGVGRAALAACAAALVLVSGFTATPAQAASSSPAPKNTQGLYGSADPKYDGVYRQSLALLALGAYEEHLGPHAVSWLRGQQCPDGGWPSYREAGQRCTHAQEDSNATAMAVRALVAVGGHGDANGKAIDQGVAWLKKQQNDEGGWSVNPGGTTDANSTALASTALTAAGVGLESVRAGSEKHTPLDALDALQLGCDAPKRDRGGFAFQADSSGSSGSLAANGKATAQAALAVSQAPLPVAKPDNTTSKAQAPACPRPKKPDAKWATRASAYHLTRALDAHHGHLVMAQPGSKKTSPDYGSTAEAAVALAAAGLGKPAQQTTGWLRKHATEWLKTQPGGGPAALAELTLAAKATGADPKDFGGVNLLQRLRDTGETEHASSSTDAGQQADQSDDSSTPSLWILLCLVVVGLGAGFALSLVRGRKRQ